MGAPPSWELRPQLVSGAQGRLRITSQSSIVILPLVTLNHTSFIPL